MKKIVLLMLFMLSSLSVTQIPAQQFAITIWVDKGCGGEYFVGDMLTVNWSTTHACEITFWEVEPDGKKRKLTTQPVIAGAGEGSRGWTLKDYGYGKRAMYAEAVSIWGMDTAECEYYVLRKAADVDVKVKDQDGQPIPGASVSVDNTVVGTTDSSGAVTVPTVEFGEHAITAAVEGVEQTSRIRIASTQKQYIDFVFTVEKRGSILVRCFNQHGDPVGGADVYADGFREGTTSQAGEFTISVSEGDHFLEAKWQNVSAQTTVTVQRNQTSFADLTLYVEVDTIIIVSVTDSGGNAVADAGVYLDNIFLGRTDTGGLVRQKVTPGSHAVRVEKQGHDPTVQNVNLAEGENTVTVVLTEEAPAYGILTLLGFLYLLKKKRL